jgi:hypothetical protein
MPGIDEDILRELMHSSTDDLHAPASVTASVIGRDRRRRWRNRALSATVTGAAAGTAFAVMASASGGADGARLSGGGISASATGRVTTAPALRLTAAQQALYRLSSAAAGAPRQTGRYVILTEGQDNYEKVSVIDSLTGDIWTYQHGAGVPSELPMDPHGSPTAAAFDALPTNPAALRSVLLAQAEQQQQQANEEMRQALKKKRGAPAAFPATGPQLTDDDLVFDQATGMLWNPLVGPALRSALYKVLAATPGVRVNSGARDSIGRPAVEISRYDSAAEVDEETFENPATGATLETAFVYTESGTEGTDIYQSITSSNTLPANPFGS